jgi:hypothetical protein
MCSRSGGCGIALESFLIALMVNDAAIIKLKKKIAVALARQLAIDLWRWRTGRATAAELGWKVSYSAGNVSTAN